MAVKEERIESNKETLGREGLELGLGEEDFNRVIKFIESIGIETELIENKENKENIKNRESASKCVIERGRVLFSKGAKIGIILRKAGNLATIPREIRREISGNVEESIERIVYGSNRNRLIDERIIYSNTLAVIGWAYYVLRHLEIDPFHLVEDMDIDDKKKRGLIKQLENGLSNPYGSIFSSQLFHLGLLRGVNELYLDRWCL